MSPPTATLIARETVNNYSHQLITQIVERILAEQKLHPVRNVSTLELYSFGINRQRHELRLTQIPQKSLLNKLIDEGFESDIDSVSLLSSDGDSFTEKLSRERSSAINKDNHTAISDSANSSSASDSSDTEVASNKNISPTSTSPILSQKEKKLSTNETNLNYEETYKLDNIICYTNVKFPKILGFIVKNNLNCELILFDCINLLNYDKIRYAFNAANNALTSNFSNSCKNNTKLYNSISNSNNNDNNPSNNFNSKRVSSINNKVNVNSSSSKFNLLQRTDKNGVTHIEISRGDKLNNVNNTSYQPSKELAIDQHSSIISINTPETDQAQSERNLALDYQLKSSNLNKIRSVSHSDLLTLNESLNEKLKLKLINQIKSSNQRLNTDFKIRNDEHGNNNGSNQRNEIEAIIRTDLDLESMKRNEENSQSLSLRKIWKSAEDILDNDDDILDSNDVPKKPERRKRLKGRAPPPPNILKGQYVRVNVDPNKNLSLVQSDVTNKLIKKPLSLSSFESNKLENYNSNWRYVASQPTLINHSNNPLRNSSSLSIYPANYEKNIETNDLFTNKQSSSEFKTVDFIDGKAFTLNRKISKDSNNNNVSFLKNFEFHKWTNSVPRIPKMTQVRSRSESRYLKNNNPYKFVDTTSSNYQTMPLNSNKFHQKQPQQLNQNNYNNGFIHSNTISNRLFGLSQKLKEFGNNVVNPNGKILNGSNTITGSNVSTLSRRRNSIGELTFKANSVGNLSSRYGSGDNVSNLKSVIKKDCDSRRLKNSNEKKVTFSAFATVQVV